MRSRQNEKFKIIFLLLLVVVIFVAPIYIIRQSILSAEKKISVTVAPHLTPQEFSAQSEKLNSLMRQQGMTSTFNYVSDEIKSNPSFARDCHPLLHDLGHAAYSYYGGYAQAIKYQNEICDSGYTHGVLESYLSSAPNLIQALQTACSGTATENFSQWQCYHGLGHGIMLASKENISKSLTLCNTFNSVFADSACSNGVFMEHFVVTDHYGNIPKTNPTSLSDCINQTTQYKLACYTYAPTAYLTINSGDYTGAIKWCNGSESNYVGTCIGGIGSQAMKDNINSPSAAEKICSSTPGAYQDDCVSGAIGMYVYFKGSTTGADSICQNYFPHNLSACESAISSTKNQFGI